MSDWPDEWEDLVTLLLELLSSASPNSVHGALQLLTELVVGLPSELHDKTMDMAWLRKPTLPKISYCPSARISYLDC